VKPYTTTVSGRRRLHLKEVDYSNSTGVTWKKLQSCCSLEGLIRIKNALSESLLKDLKNRAVKASTEARLLRNGERIRSGADSEFDNYRLILYEKSFSLEEVRLKDRLAQVRSGSGARSPYWLVKLMVSHRSYMTWGYHSSSPVSFAPCQAGYLRVVILIHHAQLVSEGSKRRVNTRNVLLFMGNLSFFPGSFSFFLAVMPCTMIGVDVRYDDGEMGGAVERVHVAPGEIIMFSGDQVHNGCCYSSFNLRWHWFSKEQELHHPPLYVRDNEEVLSRPKKCRPSQPVTRTSTPPGR